MDPLILILISLVLFTAETEKEFGIGQLGALRLANVLIVWVFCIEFILRLYVAGVDEKYRGRRGFLAYIKANWAMILVDFIAFAPELLFLIISASPPSWLRALRVCRLFKMARYVPAFRLVISTLRSCYQEWHCHVKCSDFDRPFGVAFRDGQHLLQTPPLPT